MTTYYAKVPFSGVIDVKFERSDFNINKEEIAKEQARLYLKRGLDAYRALDNKVSKLEIDTNRIEFIKPYPTCAHCGCANFEIIEKKSTIVEMDCLDNVTTVTKQASCVECKTSHTEEFANKIEQYILHNS